MRAIERLLLVAGACFVLALSAHIVAPLAAEYSIAFRRVNPCPGLTTAPDGRLSPHPLERAP